MKKTSENKKTGHQEKDTSSVAGIIHNAARLCQQNQIEDSLKEIRKDGGIALRDPRGQCILGVIFNNMGKTEEALEAFDAAIRISPALPEAHNNRGNVLKALDRLEDALGAYDDALKLRQDYADAHYNRGHALMKLDRLEDALGAYDQAVKLRPAYPEAHNNRGNVLKALDRLEEALGAYGEALKHNPAHVMAHINRGIVLNRLNRPERALDAYDNALRLQPANAEAHCNRGKVLKELGRLDEALEAFDKALKLQPEDPRAGNNRASLLGDTGQLDEALEAYDKVLKHDPTFARAHTNRGTLLMEAGRLDEAVAAFEAALAHEGSRSIRTLYAVSQIPASLINVDILSLIDQAEPDDNDNKEEFESLRSATRGVELDKAGRHDEAWENIIASNQRPFQQKQAEYLKKRKLRRMVLAWLRNDPPAKLPDDVPGKPLSLHILGTSRSGKTTLEKMVASLDGVTRGFESSIVQDALHHAFDALGISKNTAALELPPPVEAKWSECYFAELEKKASGDRLFTNTHPGNVRAVFRMATALPNSRFIFMKRELRDVYLRIYMKKYRSGNAYAYHIDNVIEYVTWYNEMIDILAARFPRITAVINYEDMIGDPAATLRAAAKLCGIDTPRDLELPYLGDDRGCGAPYKTLMPVEISEPAVS